MAAPMKSKTDGRKSLQNAISGISRYLKECRMEKLQEALSYLRKKIASDNLHAELFRESGGISVLLFTVRKLITKCCDESDEKACVFHSKLSVTLENRLKGSDKKDCEAPNENAESSAPSQNGSVEDKCCVSQSVTKSLEIAVSILANCCYVDPASQKKVSSLLGIPLMVIIFRAIDEQSLLNRICRCLANLCCGRSILEEIVEERFVEDLVPRLVGAESEDCQRTYIRAIRLLGASKRGLADIIKHRGVFAVASRITSTNVEVKKAAVRAILDLSSGQRFDADAYEQIVVSKCLTQIVPWLKSDDANLRHDAQSIIYKLLVSDQIRAEFGNAGGIDYLYGELKTPETRKTSLLQSLLWCTRESVNRMKIRDCGALDLLLEFMSEDELANQHCDIIAGFCNFIYDDISMQRLVERKIVKTVLGALLRLNELPALDVCRLARKMAESYASMDDGKASNQEVIRYSMDSPSYEHNEWEWTGDFAGDVLCKTTFEPIGWQSPPRCESVSSSGGYSPTPSTSYWSMPASPSAGSASPGRSRVGSPPMRRSPSPPPSPPSPTLPEVAEDDVSVDSEKEEGSVYGPTKAQRSSNHILALLLRFTELDLPSFFKENAHNLTSSLFSYAILVDEPSKNLWILLSRLMNELQIFTELLDMNWPYLMATVFLSNDSFGQQTTMSDSAALNSALQSDCCARDCDRFECNISQHMTAASNSLTCKKEVRKVLEGFVGQCETYYGRGTLAQMIGAASKKGIGDGEYFLLNVAALCRKFSQTESTRPVVQNLLTHGGLKCLIETYFGASASSACVALALINLAESLPWPRDRNALEGDNLKDSNNVTETSVELAGNLESTERPTNNRKRKASDQSESAVQPAAKRQKNLPACCHDDRVVHDVTFLLDDGSEVGGNESNVCEASEVFRAMLRGHFRESGQKNKVRLKGIGRTQLGYILHSLNCPNEDCAKLNDNSHLEVTDLLEVLRICDQYLLEEVKNHALARILRTISLDNVVVVLRTGVLMNEGTLIEACFEKIFSERVGGVGKKVRILKRLAEFPEDVRTLFAESTLSVLVRVVRTMAAGRNKS